MLVSARNLADFDCWSYYTAATRIGRLRLAFAGPLQTRQVIAVMRRTLNVNSPRHVNKKVRPTLGLTRSFSPSRSAYSPRETTVGPSQLNWMRTFFKRP